ncbi:MAG TPA: metallophosphoesterase [Thermomicrobiales bacterium]|nr:metallophosphoesterase [Thermomicrobiales bacterium]
MPVHVLAVSDQIDERIYSETIRQRMPDVQMVLSCGDLPARYLEFLADALGKPVYFVLGNHAEELTRGGDWGKRYRPLGCIDLCGKVLQDPSTGLILAGLPGSPKYNEHEPEQYTEVEMTWMILRMAPRLLWNRWRHGRALDVLVTHAPPLHLNDQPEDPAHRGFLAIRRFLRWFRPVYHLHGHVHLYDRSRSARVDFEDTSVINVFPYQTLDLEVVAITDAALPVAAASRDREVEPVQATSMEPR